ncbi:MAG: hypothetical protein QOG47_1932 [Mycobacterium sp.]|nr:hypothetical protein [Mycobacterium sp.]
MNWTIAKFAAAGALTVMPIAAVGIPACAVASPGSTPNVLPAPPPADPANDTPTPPAPHGEYYNPNDSNDWWYNHSADSGGGGG